MSIAFSPLRNVSARLPLAVLLTAAADFLLFGQPVGLSLVLFCLLLGLGIAASNGRASPFSLLLLCAALLPLLEAVNPLSLGVALACLAAFALAASRRLRRSLAGAVRQCLGFLLALPFRLVLDMASLRRSRRKGGSTPKPCAALLVWIMPLGLTAVFLGLFGLANPVIAHWLSLIDLPALLDAERVAFWIPVLAAVWMFLRPRLGLARRLVKPKRAPTLPLPADASPPPGSGLLQTLFGRDAILRALLVFNALFAVQTVLDAAYLWGGVALPDGLTYAGYAHRGAYPLVVTALLAAAFVLAATRRGSAAAADRRVRALVCFWTAQNIGLVLSAILRLDLYVGIYALTFWRVAAFLWMGLVAAGLALILARIALNRSNGWLVGANLLVLFATLFACCFVNFPALIAGYNVSHSSELGGGGESLDAWYLISLGPQAVPAIDKFLAEADPSSIALLAPVLRWERDRLAGELRTRLASWRAWTFRDWRLSRMLEGGTGRVRE